MGEGIPGKEGSRPGQLLGKSLTGMERLFKQEQDGKMDVQARSE